ncbi:MAG TPA: hypothetical protein V6D21_01905 [Candidatus Obscuribacterales bacterium]
MQITKISFGVTISRDFQSKRYDLEAVLEPWENHEESFKVLREKVCELANVHPGEYLTAAERAEDLELQISENQSAIQARKQKLGKRGAVFLMNNGKKNNGNSSNLKNQPLLYQITPL